MIEGSCKLCGNKSGEEVLDISSHADTYMDYLGFDYSNTKRTYKKCEKCSLVFRNPILDDKEKELLYNHFRDYSLRKETPAEYFKRIIQLPQDKSENHEKYEYLSRFIGSSGRLMDVGAGFGVFAYGFSKQFENWNAIGVEPTKGVAKIAETYGIKLFEIYLDANSHSTLGQDFDLVSTIHVLEHVDKPLEFIKMLASFLKKDGMLYIEVPSLLDVGYLPPEHDRFMSQHEVIFEKSVLRNTVESCGLETVDVENFVSKRQRNNLRILCKKGI